MARGGEETSPIVFSQASFRTKGALSGGARTGGIAVSPPARPASLRGRISISVFQLCHSRPPNLISSRLNVWKECVLYKQRQAHGLFFAGLFLQVQQ